MVPSPLFVGIDVAKATLDIAVRPTAETWSAPNDATGIDALVTRLGALAPTLIVLEATGGYQGPLVAALVAAALPVVVVNPRHIRAFAQAVGILAKTDRIDARVIAHFAEAVKPAPRPLPDAQTRAARSAGAAAPARRDGERGARLPGHRGLERGRSRPISPG